MSTPPAPPPAPTLDVDPTVGTSLGFTGSTAAVPPAALVAGVRARGSGVDPEARPRPRSPPPSPARFHRRSDGSTPPPPGIRGRRSPQPSWRPRPDAARGGRPTRE